MNRHPVIVGGGPAGMAAAHERLATACALRCWKARVWWCGLSRAHCAAACETGYLGAAVRGSAQANCAVISAACRAIDVRLQPSAGRCRRYSRAGGA